MSVKLSPEAQTLDGNLPIIDRVSSDQLLELAGQRVRAHHGNRDRHIRTWKRTFGPSDVSSELIEERRFDSSLQCPGIGIGLLGR